jgi:hypothetical protein
MFFANFLLATTQSSKLNESQQGTTIPPIATQFSIEKYKRKISGIKAGECKATGDQSWQGFVLHGY